MKKLVIFFSVFIVCIALISCNLDTQNSSNEILNTSSTQIETTTQNNTSEVSTIITTQDNTIVTYDVQVDCLVLNSSGPDIEVTVGITVNKPIVTELETRQYGPEGVINVRIVSIVDENIHLYDNIFDIPVTTDIEYVNLFMGDTLSRTILFGKTPFNGGLEDEEVAPLGSYEVQVKLSFQNEWVSTGIIITVED